MALWEKFREWSKDHYNTLFLCILFSALGLRMYYLLNTYDQGLWWDEAEYLLKAKNLVFGTPDTGWFAGRAPLFPLIAALVFKIGGAELAIRVLEICFSLLGIGVLYLLGRELYTPRVGAIASFLLSVFYLDLFFSNRILVDIPSSSLGLLGTFLFYRAYRHNHNALAVWSGVVLMLAILMKFPAGLFAVIIALFMLFITKGKVISDRKTAYALCGFFIAAVPFIIWWYLSGDINSIFFTASQNAGLPFGEKIALIFKYVLYVPTYFKSVLFVIFAVSLVQIINLFLSIDLILKGKSAGQEKDILPFLGMVIMFLHTGFFINHFEERYLIYAFPFMFLIVGKGLSWFFDALLRFGRGVAILTTLIILSLIAYQHISFGDDLIKNSQDGYTELKEAGLWIKEHSAARDLVYASAVPQLTYFSERFVQGMPAQDEFELRKREAKYFVLSAFERSPEWAYSYPQEHPEVLEPVAVFKRGDQPIVVVYTIK